MGKSKYHFLNFFQISIQIANSSAWKTIFSLTKCKRQSTKQLFFNVQKPHLFLIIYKNNSSIIKTVYIVAWCTFTGRRKIAWAILTFITNKWVFIFVSNLYFDIAHFATQLRKQMFKKQMFNKAIFIMQMAIRRGMTLYTASMRISAIIPVTWWLK